jgi:hypothetical protein
MLDMQKQDTDSERRIFLGGVISDILPEVLSQNRRGAKMIAKLGHVVRCKQGQNRSLRGTIIAMSQDYCIYMTATGERCDRWEHLEIIYKSPKTASTYLKERKL